MDFGLAFPDGFSWRDGERLIQFRRGALVAATDLLRERGWGRFELLTTERAIAAAPLGLPESAEAVHYVAAGPVPAVSADLFDAVRVPTLVALGGGRVIDTAKAIAAVRGGRVCAIPTTLSGAETTAIHRLPEGRTAPHLIRPALVLADPDLMASQPERSMRHSAMNALAHGADSLYTPLANPVSRDAALRGAALIAGSLDRPAEERDRAALALGSLLSAYALDSALFSLHHVVSQSLVRILETSHAGTNAAILPLTMRALLERAPEAMAALAAALGVAPGGLVDRLRELGGGCTLAELGADRDRLPQAVAAMLQRPELRMTPDPPDADELTALVDAAF